jgi:hypothetical protein
MTSVERPSNILLVLVCLQIFWILGESDAPGIYIGNSPLTQIGKLFQTTHLRGTSCRLRGTITTSPGEEIWAVFLSRGLSQYTS